MSHDDHQNKMPMTLLNSQYVIVRTLPFELVEKFVLRSSIHSRSCARGSDIPSSTHDPARSPWQIARA